MHPLVDIFLAAARNLGVDPANCVVIEDAVAGVAAARAAGMRVIGVTTTLAPAAMAAAAPDCVFGDVRSITLEDICGLRPLQQQEQVHCWSCCMRAALPQQVLLGTLAWRSIAHVFYVQGSLQVAQPAGNINQPDSSSSGGRGASTSWLEGTVSLPAGYRTTRRDLLKFASLGAAFTSLYVGLSRAQVRPSGCLPFPCGCCGCLTEVFAAGLEPPVSATRVHGARLPPLQREPAVRRFLLQYHVPTLVQLGIVAYVASGWSYFRKVASAAGVAAQLCTWPVCLITCAFHPMPLPLQSLSYVSPQALLNALLPQTQLPPAEAEQGSTTRVAAFKRYIAGLAGWLVMSAL
jgi:hypothetical protein